MADQVGMADLRGLNIDKAVTGFALVEYVFKQICSVVSTSSWQEKYFQETAADLTGGSGSSIQGIPRLSAFPHLEVSETQVNSYMLKHGGEGQLSWEDVNFNDIDMVKRTLVRVARAVVKSVDTNIWNVITVNQTGVGENTVTIAAGNEWDSTTESNQNPIKDILSAKQAIYEQNYNPDSNGYLILNPKDYKNLLANANIRNAGQFFTDEVTRNGNVGYLLGLKVLVSNNVTADYAAVVVGKEAATWKEASALKTVTVEDPAVGYKIRSWETGVCQLRNPKAVCLIINTAA